MKENQIIGFITSRRGDKCSMCGIKNNLVLLEIDDKIKDLPVTKQYLVCKVCAEKQGIKIGGLI